MEDDDLSPRRVIVGMSGPSPPTGGVSGSLGRGREASSKSSQVGTTGDKKQGMYCVYVRARARVCLCTFVFACVVCNKLLALLMCGDVQCWFLLLHQ